MARLPPLNALRAFEAAGRHLNFRLASEEIGVTQGAVAQHVRALEATLNVKLFERLPRGLALTEVGRKFHAPIRRSFQMMSEATKEIQPEQAVLTMSLTPSFATKWFLPRLGRFTRGNPDLDVKIVASQELANFQSDGIDIAVRQARTPFGPGLSTDLLFPSRFQAVCSPSLMTGEHPLRTPDDLRHHVLLHDAHGLWTLYLDQVFQGKRNTKSRSMNFSQTSLVVDAALAGHGVALVSDFLIEEDVSAGRLCIPFNETLETDLGFFIVAPRQPRNPEYVNRMRKWLLEQGRAGKPDS